MQEQPLTLSSQTARGQSLDLAYLQVQLRSIRIMLILTYLADYKWIKVEQEGRGRRGVAASAQTNSPHACDAHQICLR